MTDQVEQREKNNGFYTNRSNENFGYRRFKEDPLRNEEKKRRIIKNGFIRARSSSTRPLPNYC